MGTEASHVQLIEYKKEVIPYINWMMEDIFCRYGVSIPYYLLEFDFPEYPFTPQHIPSGYGFGLGWGNWGSFLPWFNELIGLAFDLADLPRWQFTPWEIPDWKMPEWGIPDWELPQWQLRDWPEWSMKDGELRRRWGRRLGPELDVLDYMYIPPGRGFGAGVSGALGAGWRIGADWTVGGTLSARLGIEIPISIELSSPDWTVKMELEGKLREDPMRLREGQYPLGIEGFFPERTIKGKISAALGIEAPMFAEPTISPQLADMLNERIQALYDAAGIAPVAAFSGTPLFGMASLTVVFTDSSENDPTSWSWNFGDEGTSVSQNPEHQYTSRGLFTVALTATNATGSDTETKEDYIAVRGANYSYGYDTECHPPVPTEEIFETDWWDSLPGWQAGHWATLTNRFATQDFDTYSKDTLTEDATPNLGWKWKYVDQAIAWAYNCETCKATKTYRADTIESDSAIAIVDTENGAINSISVTLTADSARVKDSSSNWEDYAVTIDYTVYLHKFNNYPPTIAELNALADLLTEEDFTGMNSIHTDSITTDSNGNGSDSYEITGISSAYCGISTAIILHLDEVRTYDATMYSRHPYAECHPDRSRLIEVRSKGDSLEISGSCTIT